MTISALQKALAKDAATPLAVDGSHLFVFERTPLGITDQDKFVKGCLLDFFHKRGGADHIPVMSYYDTLVGSVFKKTGVTQEFTSEAEFYDNKTPVRAEIETMFFSAAKAGRRFAESWTAIRGRPRCRRLNHDPDARPSQQCLRYIRARSAGEPGARFQRRVQNAILAHQSEIAACTTLPEIAARLGSWVPSDYEHRDGALYVEAFEAIP